MLASRTFTEADQIRFAGVSGDRNPMDLDAIKARRTQAGVQVVHCVHVLLWSLDVLAREELRRSSVLRLKANFKRLSQSTKQCYRRSRNEPRPASSCPGRVGRRKSFLIKASCARNRRSLYDPDKWELDWFASTDRPIQAAVVGVFASDFLSRTDVNAF
jgi:hypothetical protein